MDFSNKLGRIGIGILVLFLINSCNPRKKTDKQKEEILAAWASGYKHAGELLIKAKAWPQISEAFLTGAENLNETVSTLKDMEAKGYPLEGRLIEELNLLAENMKSAAASLQTDDFQNASEYVLSISDHFGKGAPEKPEELRSMMYETSQLLKDAALTLSAYKDEGVEGLIERILNISKVEIQEIIGMADEMEDEELREWFNLDDPDVLEGIELFKTGEGFKHLDALRSDLAGTIKMAIQGAFIDQMNVFGNNLVGIGNGVGGAPIAFFISIWDDECTPEGAKQGCTIKNINITYCGHSPDDVKKLKNFANKLPFGRVAIAATTLITRLNYPVSIYVKCEFELCEDTPCLPLIGTELEWVTQEKWVEIKNENIDTTGPGDCWSPRGWTPRERMLFRRHMTQILRQECGC